MYKKILVPTDGSEFAEKAEEHALFLAKESGAEIIALAVVETSFSKGLPVDETIESMNQLLKEEANINIGMVEKMKEEQHLDIQLSLMVEEGSPAEVILDTIEKEDVDLVVMGSAGRTGFNRFIMGSVTEKVVKSAKCSVLVVY